MSIYISILSRSQVFFLKRPQIDAESFQLKKLEKEEQVKHKVNRRKEIIKVRTEIGELKNRKTRGKLRKLKVASFKRSITFIELIKAKKREDTS